MDVYEAIKTRRSVRAYQDKPVPEDALNRILDQQAIDRIGSLSL